jgi:hypothetical protein
MMGAALYHRALMLPHQGRPQTPGHRRGPIPAMCQYQGSPVLYHRALMLPHQGRPQTPGGRIRALGFARMGARGRRRGPIPAVCHRYSSPVSDIECAAA